MAENTFRFENTALNFDIVGSGARVLLMFHGFGQDHRAFQALEKPLSEAYTLYIFDLYFHGKSNWGYGEQPLEKSFWNQTLSAFFKKYQIVKFTLLGFSLGGKFVLATLEAFPEKIAAVYLLAPDGIKTSFWYSLATYPIPFRRIFRAMIRHHHWFTSIANSLRALGLMDKGLIRFVEHQMDTEEKRRRVYCSWVVLRHLRFNMTDIAAIVNKHAIPFCILAGQFDKVIMPANMHHLLKRIENYRLEILPCGHNGLIAESLPYLEDKH